MGVYMYFDIKINFNLLNSIPNETTSKVSFYLYNYGSDPAYWNQRLTDISLKKVDDAIIPNAVSNINYIYDSDLTLEQDGEDVYLYKSAEARPSDPRIFARTSTLDQAYIACSKCELIYNSENKCTLVMHLVPTTIKVNIINHINPPNLIVPMSTAWISSITIQNDRNNTVLYYTPSKNNDTFRDTYQNLTLRNGLPAVLERDEDDIFLYRPNEDKPLSSIYRATSVGAMSRYLSVDKIKFTYVSDYEVDMDIYFAKPHGRVVEYYAIYEYTMAVPDNVKVGEEEEEAEP